MLTYNLVEVANENCDRGHHKFQLLKVKTNSHCKLQNVYQKTIPVQWVFFRPNLVFFYLETRAVGGSICLLFLKCFLLLYMFLSFSLLFFTKFQAFSYIFHRFSAVIFPVFFHTSLHFRIPYKMRLLLVLSAMFCLLLDSSICSVVFISYRIRHRWAVASTYVREHIPCVVFKSYCCGAEIWCLFDPGSRIQDPR